MPIGYSDLEGRSSAAVLSNALLSRLLPPGPVRSGADALPGRSLGGDYIPSGMANLNPTMGQVSPPGSIPWRDLPYWQSAAPGGHDESMGYSMAQLAEQMQARDPLRALVMAMLNPRRFFTQ